MPWASSPVILFGDFGQLQPWGVGIQPFWKSSVSQHSTLYNLTTPVRHASATAFHDFLNDNRLGNITQQIVEVLSVRRCTLRDLPEECLYLVSILTMAQTRNKTRLSKLEGISKFYHFIDVYKR